MMNLNRIQQYEIVKNYKMNLGAWKMKLGSSPSEAGPGKMYRPYLKKTKNKSLRVCLKWKSACLANARSRVPS
jgi:hypothetical protein